VRVSAVDPADLTVFVGAGISKPSGAPDFQRLRDAFLAPLLDGRAPDVTMDDFSPEALFDAIDDGRPRTRELFRRAMWRMCETCEPGANHYAVAALGAAGARVWTTNFDTMIERAAARLGIPCTVVAPPASALDVRELRRPGELVLLKVHGSFPFTGDPPVEPDAHDYPLLFRATDVWRQLGKGWADQLTDDIDGRSVRVFGYRGADMDIVPILLGALPRAHDVVWWEMAAAVDNINKLRTVFARSPTVEVAGGDASAELHKLADAAAPELRDRRAALPVGTPPPDGAPPPDRWPIPVTWSAKASVRGRFHGAAEARKAYAMAILSDPVGLKGGAAWRLLRSNAYDHPAFGARVLAVLRICAALAPGRCPPRVWDLYATLFDVQPLSRRDAADRERLERSPAGGTADVLVRLASKEKRMGRLAAAAGHASAALDELRRRPEPDPLLEAMITYNLAWIQRQRHELAARAEAVDGYQERRLAHIGFNWAAWLSLDDVLLALDRGDVAEARARIDGPMLALARNRIGHPAFIADADQAWALLIWHEEGSGAARGPLEVALASARRTGARGFTTVDSLLLLADLERAEGHRDRMRRRLAEARAATSSSLQLARADLVEAAGSADPEQVERVRAAAEDAGFGLLAEAARHALVRGADEPTGGLC
jgi:SIR2-like domain